MSHPHHLKADLQTHTFRLEPSVNEPMKTRAQEFGSIQAYVEHLITADLKATSAQPRPSTGTESPRTPHQDLPNCGTCLDRQCVDDLASGLKHLLANPRASNS